MSLWQEFFRDPVIFFSFTGLAILVGMCIFYAVYFYLKMIKAEARAEKSNGEKSNGEQSTADQNS